MKKGCNFREVNEYRSSALGMGVLHNAIQTEQTTRAIWDVGVSLKLVFLHIM